MGRGWRGSGVLALLDAAVIAMAVGIFEAQAHLWTIFLQVEQLLAVERSSTLPGKETTGSVRRLDKHLLAETTERHQLHVCIIVKVGEL